MKKHITTSIFMAVLASVATAGCADANSSSNSNDACQTPGFVKCNGICIDPMTSSSYCGANEFCENYEICKDAQTCQVGKCSSTTPSNACQTPGFVKCNGTCIDPMTSNSYCGANEFCENYEICKDAQTCQEGKCSSTTTPEPSNTCQTPGFVKCNGTCIDPMTSNSYCGANEFCENYEICKDTQTCQEGKCQAAPCQANEHKYNDICENDSLTDCGKHWFACASEVDGWKSGTCEEHQCKPSACMEGKHIYQNTCEDDSITNCGNHDVRCSQQIVGWLDGTCVQGACHVSACENGLHRYGNTCETDDTENCGSHGIACSSVISGWETGTCLQTECRVTACIQGMHIDENSCVFDSVDDCGMKGLACKDHVAGWKSGACTEGKCKVLQCIDGYHIDATTGECTLDTNQCCGVTCIKCTGEKVCGNGQCREQCPKNTEYCSNACVDTQQHPNHCGECGHDCNAEKPENAKSMTCNQGTCLVSVCNDNYHIEIQDKTRVCQPDTVSACGIDAIDCASQPWWKDGACTDGTCVPSACKGDYHLTENETGEYWCEPDNALNCGEHGHVCGDGQQCVGGRCLGNTVCDDIVRDTLTDLDHCGECSHPCDEGLICSNGECKSGNGLMYCNGVKINSTNDSENCNGCGKHCPVGSICGNTSDYVDCYGETGITYCSGIQRNTSNDSANCGQCGKLCGIGEICTNGVCTSGTGQTYCNGTAVDISNDYANCGQCGKACGVGQICQDGVCTTCKVGDIITFGRYEQDNTTSNGKEPIEWRVLDIDSDGHLLIISDKVLDNQPYNTTDISITWEKSTIRSWLNGYDSSYNTVGTSYTSNNFIDTAFTPEEKARVIASNVPAHYNPYYSASPGKATTDKIFLLSVVEAESYFKTDEARKAYPTLYAVNNGVTSHSSNTILCSVVDFQPDKCSSHWWLRSPGGSWYYEGRTYYFSACVAAALGVISRSNINHYDFGVRPALLFN